MFHEVPDLHQSGDDFVTVSLKGSKEREVNGIINNSMKMPGSRGRIGPGGVRGKVLVRGPRGRCPLGETEFSHFYSLKVGLSWTEVS